MEPLAATLVHYVEETRRLAAHGSTTEGTYYPAIRDLIVHILRERRLPFEVRTGTSEARAGGSDFPDFTLADRALFVGVFGEVKRPGETLEAMASSTERADQIGRYLARTGTVLLSNVRGFGLLVCAPGYERVAGTPVPPSARELVATVDLWSALSGSGAKAQSCLGTRLWSLSTARPAPRRRLSNALTGWHDPGEIKLTFPEMREEFTASQGVKRDQRIIVVLGNPPYDRFAGIAQAEEAELVAHYKGVELVIERDSEGKARHDEFGRPRRKQRGQSLLYKEFGVRKQLLDDLYIRFIRLAEQRIGEAADRGIVSFISNSSYLTGRSHPLMRRSLLTSFHEVWIDNLNGDKFRTGKLIPRGLPGAGTADQSAFSTDADPRGIQPGTAIVTWLKRPQPRGRPETAVVLYRDLWGLARWKRQALLASLPAAEPPAGSSTPMFARIAPAPRKPMAALTASIRRWLRGLAKSGRSISCDISGHRSQPRAR